MPSDVLVLPTESSVRVCAAFKEVLAVAEEGCQGFRVFLLQDADNGAQEVRLPIELLEKQGVKSPCVLLQDSHLSHAPFLAGYTVHRAGSRMSATGGDGSRAFRSGHRQHGGVRPLPQTTSYSPPREITQTPLAHQRPPGLPFRLFIVSASKDAVLLWSLQSALDDVEDGRPAQPDKVGLRRRTPAPRRPTLRAIASHDAHARRALCRSSLSTKATSRLSPARERCWQPASGTTFRREGVSSFLLF